MTRANDYVYEAGKDNETSPFQTRVKAEGHDTELPGCPVMGQSATDLHNLYKMTALPSAAAVAVVRVSAAVTYDITSRPTHPYLPWPTFTVDGC